MPGAVPKSWPASPAKVSFRNVLDEVMKGNDRVDPLSPGERAKDSSHL
jgi:hypothetical protein